MELQWTAKECANLYQHTVPIFDYDRGQPSLIGTGVFVLVEGYHFIGTAAHVFEQPFKKVAFGYMKAERQFEIFGADNMPILMANAEYGRGDSRSAVYKDGLDLAVIKPTEEVLGQLLHHYRPYNPPKRQRFVASLGDYFGLASEEEPIQPKEAPLRV